ncbi:hypothetical protein BDN70DRAFT_973215 [Pholiota conissans]|uniref:DUF6533 domain-containing protein n=1 Tax=Pholiota conissans TaxID=109636 RepID=A0A9P5YQ68_9AGAR|nr:hypothetical protein BDN70DRAFT_973215 [Pholiota conissans]
MAMVIAPAFDFARLPDVLPNPSTPMAFLSPEVAFQFMIKSYVAVGMTAVLLWDILNHLPDDYRLLTKYPIKVPTCVYILSRFSVLLYTIACVIFDTAPITHCVRVDQFLDWSFPIVQSSTSLLFVLRVCAVYNNSNLPRTFFGITWLAVAASTLVVSLGMEASNIGTTRYCIYTRNTPYIALTFIVSLLHETFVFVAITWRLLQNTHVDCNLRRGFRIVVFGHYLPIFSKTLLQDGQIYYLTTITTSLLTVILLYLPFAPSYKILFTLPNIVLVNIMACHVFRSTKLGRRCADESMIDTAHLRFNTVAATRLSDPILPLSSLKRPRPRRPRRNTLPKPEIFIAW